MTLKDKLEFHYRAFDKSQLSPDPLEIPHRFNNKEDIELTAFIASLFAFGSVGLIIRQIDKVLLPLGEKPYQSLMAMSDAELKKYFCKNPYRFYSEKDVYVLFNILQRLLRKFGGIEKLFDDGGKSEVSVKKLFSNFSHRILREVESAHEPVTRGIKFMFPSPNSGSACKRMNLFLRWMVRKDELDFGLWDVITPAQLLIPVDTHIAKICRRLKLTHRNNADWKMAEEITFRLKTFDPTDPIKYDFALCHISMRGLKF